MHPLLTLLRGIQSDKYTVEHQVLYSADCSMEKVLINDLHSSTCFKQVSLRCSVADFLARPPTTPSVPSLHLEVRCTIFDFMNEPNSAPIPPPPVSLSLSLIVAKIVIVLIFFSRPEAPEGVDDARGLYVVQRIYPTLFHALIVAACVPPLLYVAVYTHVRTCALVSRAYRFCSET